MNGGHQTAGAPAPTKNDEQQLHLDHTAPTSPPHCNAYPAPSEGGFIGREDKMAGKNDCGMAGKGWREMGGGKRVAGKSWREHMAGKGSSSSKGKVSASIEDDDDDFM